MVAPHAKEIAPPPPPEPETDHMRIHHDPPPPKKDEPVYSLKPNQIDKGNDYEGYWQGQKDTATEVKAGDGTIVAPTHENPAHAPKYAEKKPDVP